MDYPIERIRFRNVHAGFRCYAINADGARYCRTPLFREEEQPAGVGMIRNVSIDRMTCRRTAGSNPAIAWETRADDVSLSDFRFMDQEYKAAALQVRNTPDLCITADDNIFTVQDKKEALNVTSFRELKINRITAADE